LLSTSLYLFLAEDAALFVVIVTGGRIAEARLQLAKLTLCRF
jgi:hypothetical protein